MNHTVISSVKKYRLSSDITQEELAKKAGVTRQTIIAVEKGNYVPSVLLALRLGKSLNTTVENLFKEKKQ